MGQGVTIDGWLDRKATAEFLQVTDWWLEKWHANLDVAPPYIKHGRKVWYRRMDLKAWLADPEKTARVREANGFVLGSIYAMNRALSPSPDPAELQNRYDAEHGESTEVWIPRHVWVALRATLTLPQRKLLKDKIQVRA